jgi:hypothetical protein
MTTSTVRVVIFGKVRLNLIFFHLRVASSGNLAFINDKNIIEEKKNKEQLN